MRAFVGALFFGLFGVINSSRVSYTGQQILRCSFKNSSVISQLEDDMDVWGVLPGGFVDVRVKTSNERTKLESLVTDCEVVIPDLERDVEKFEALNLAARSKPNAEWFEAYHTYQEIYSWYEQLAIQNPRLVTFNSSIGGKDLTWNGNPQPSIRIFNVDAQTNPNPRPTRRIYWQAQIHAREWISGATVNFVVNEIVNRYKEGDRFLTSFFNTVELVVVPFTNPDGYEWTWSNDRLWRKNRRPASGVAGCVGVDNNRNYNDHWGQGGSSTQPCSDTYMGPTAASEPETKNTVRYYQELQAEGTPIVGAIDWHSYSQLILRPYGWTSADSPDEERLKALGDELAEVIYNTSGKVYTSQKSIDLYITTGGAADWFYGDEATRGNNGFRTYSYTIELRPAGSPPGFELPPIEIIPTGREQYAAMVNYFLFIETYPIP